MKFGSLDFISTVSFAFDVLAEKDAEEEAITQRMIRFVNVEDNVE